MILTFVHCCSVGERVMLFDISVEDEQTRSENCIKQVTENFILGLQEGFPATIPTICRTGDKMSRLIESCDVVKCALCGGRLVNISY